MISRRNLLKAASLLTSSGMIAALSDTATAQYTLSPSTTVGDRKIRFGVIADPQYAPIPSNKETRFYANTLWKLADCIDELNQRELSFVTTLGDIIDRHWDSYSHILPVYDTLKHDHHFVLGNHDFDVGKDYTQSVVRTLGMPSHYYDFSYSGFRFIVIDGNDVSLFAPPKGNPYLNIPDDPRLAIAQERYQTLTAQGAINAQPWNGSLSDQQFLWLDDRIKAAALVGEKVVVLSHYPVYPINEHNLWDSERIVELLTSYDHVIAYFCGHNHKGNYGTLAGKHFLNFKGMVESPTDTAYSVVEIDDEKITIRGFGAETSRVLPLS